MERPTSHWPLAFVCLAGCGGPEALPPAPAVPRVEPGMMEVPCADCVTHVVRGGDFGYVDGPVEEALFELPRDVAHAPSGEVFVADQLSNAIRVVREGVVETFAGNGEGGFRDGLAADALFAGPAGIAVGPDGTVYVADTMNHRIRRIRDGVVTTFAGTGEAGYLDGPVNEALFYLPVDVDVDREGNVLVVDFGSNSVRRISKSLTVETLAGGPDTQEVARARFVASGPSGAVYFTDGERNLIRKVHDGQLTTLAGCVFAGDVEGDRQIARFEDPTGIAVDARERVFVSDTGNRRIKMIDGDVVTTLAGSGYAGDMDGDAGEATFYTPLGLSVGYDGALYVTELRYSAVRRVPLH